MSSTASYSESTFSP